MSAEMGCTNKHQYCFLER